MNKTFLIIDPAAGALSKKEKTLYFFLLFFFFALYMPGVSWLYNAAMWLVFVYSFFFNSIPEKLRLLKNRPAVLLMVLFFLINCLSALLSDNTREGISWVGIRISLFVFPLSLGSIFIGRLLKERIIAGFVVATCCAAAICLAYGIIRSITSRDWSLLYNDNLSQLVNLQSIYMAMLINMAVLGFCWLRLNRSPLFGRQSWWPVLLLLLPVHFLLASRIAIIILYGGIFMFALYIILFRKRLRQGIVLATSLVAAGLLLFLIFPKTLNRFKEIAYTRFNYESRAKESHFNMALTPEQWNGANIRIAVWKCAWTVTRHHPLLGTGLGDKMDVLRKQYAKDGFVFGIQTNRNVHNSYLDVWMSLGLVGLLVFMTGFFVWPVLQCVRLKDWYGGLVLVCLLISLVTETYIDRTIGNTLLAFFVSFIASYREPPVFSPH